MHNVRLLLLYTPFPLPEAWASCGRSTFAHRQTPEQFFELDILRIRFRLEMHVRREMNVVLYAPDPM
jgi:hypothetical protein